MGAEVQLAVIKATSPTLAEVMRSCFLHAGLSRSSGASVFALGSPRAWLGTAYHEVLERIPEVTHRGEEIEAALPRLWAAAVERQYERVKDHPLDRRFGSPTTWPGYHLAEASVKVRASELSRSIAALHRPSTPSSYESSPGEVREHQLTAYGGKLVGRPDVIRDGEVIDYKSGHIFDYDEDAHTEEVKAAYVRQLRIYASLVKEEMGWWPTRGLLYPVAGPAVAVVLDPSDCQKEAAEAVALLDTYNHKLSALTSQLELATPSSSACRWCQYKLICPAFWMAAAVTWSGQLDGAAVGGTLLAAPRSTHGGEGFSISLDVERGSEVRRQVAIGPLNAAVHSNIAGMRVGDHVRVVGLRVRSDGSLTPGQRTVIASEDELPSVIGLRVQLT